MATYIVILIAFGILIIIALPLIITDIKESIQERDTLSIVFYISIIIFVVAYLLNQKYGGWLLWVIWWKCMNISN